VRPASWLDFHILLSFQGLKFNKNLGNLKNLFLVWEVPATDPPPEPENSGFYLILKIFSMKFNEIS